MTGVLKRRTFPSTPASAGQARRFVESVLAGGLEHLSYGATMMVSELVANAVLHTGTPIEVVVRADEDRVRVEVHDGSPQLPVRKHYSTMSGTGRGLLLVEQMSSDWGSKRTDHGKVVWFEIDGRSAPVMNLFDDVDAL
jgi:anti-sigma regulatory factor (Ser/Thr protein kinase)